jgi:superfamily II DNA/RNA helicase
VLTQLPQRTDNFVYVELAPEQQGPYEEQRVALARLLGKNFLTDLDRKRILASIVNMRTICDSLFLFDRQSRVSPKLDEFAELIPDVIGKDTEPTGGSAVPHKAVVFSQWETMIFEVAKVLDGLGVGYAVLHGGLSGKDRKESLEKFKNDPACRVFLSTDAGGTGLNLQNADTVVNLELPWNPAVLEQRIARVHRMGQSRPVRVVNFVTRGTIEEKVLRTLEAKQGLFAGLFTGDADELPFEALANSGFLDTIRDFADVAGQQCEIAQPKPTSTIEKAPTTTVAESVSGHLWLGLTQLIESMKNSLSATATATAIPPDVRERLRIAARQLADQLERDTVEHNQAIGPRPSEIPDQPLDQTRRISNDSEPG